MVVPVDVAGQISYTVRGTVQRILTPGQAIHTLSEELIAGIVGEVEAY